MKKTFTLVTLTLLTIASTTLHAQLNKGSIALGGNISFYSVKTEDHSAERHQTSLYISPSLTSFYKDNHAVGFHLDYFHNQSDSSNKANSYGAGVSLRQYKPLGKAFYIFVQEGLDYSYYKNKPSVDNIQSKFTQNSVSIALNPGVAYDLSKRIQFEILFFNNLLSASYLNQKTESPVNVFKSNQFSFSANTTITDLTTLNVGAKIFFGR